MPPRRTPCSNAAHCRDLGRRAILLTLLLAAVCAPAVASASWIADGPDARTASTSATFAFDAPGATSYTCSLDDAGETSCESGQEYTDLAEGPHWFVLQPSGEAGPFDAAEVLYWYVDLTPPETVLISAPDGLSGPYPRFHFDGDEDASFECSLDAQPFAPCTSAAVPGPLADGRHAFAVRATDVVGHPDPTPAVHVWTVDATPPQISAATFTTSAAARTATATFGSNPA